MNILIKIVSSESAGVPNLLRFEIKNILHFSKRTKAAIANCNRASHAEQSKTFQRFSGLVFFGFVN